VKLTPRSSDRNPTGPTCKRSSPKRPNRPHIPSSSINVKEQTTQNNKQPNQPNSHRANSTVHPILSTNPATQAARPATATSPPSGASVSVSRYLGDTAITRKRKKRPASSFCSLPMFCWVFGQSCLKLGLWITTRSVDNSGNSTPSQLHHAESPANPGGRPTLSRPPFVGFPRLTQGQPERP